MRIVISALLILAVAASATVRVGGYGGSNQWESRGTYSVVDVLAGGLTYSYGLAIKDTEANSIWILNWGEYFNYEFEMSSGSMTGTSWELNGGEDCDDQAFVENAGGGQWLVTDWVSSMFSVYQEDGTFSANITGPAGYTNLFGIGASDSYVYVGSPNEAKLAWGAYTGTESSITWTDMDYAGSIYGLAVHDGFLFVSCGGEGVTNLFIHAINGDGSPVATPEWSCMFTDEVEANGGIDYDGTYLWLYPQNTFLYKLDIDWVGGALNSDTWAGIKASF